MDISINYFSPDDLLEIERIASACNTYFPTINDQVFVAKKDKKIIAYIAWQIVLDEANLLALAVTSAYRKQGIATKLHQVTCPKALCFLEVRSSNDEAINLYQKLQYKFLHKRKNYYRNPSEDALIFRADFRI